MAAPRSGMAQFAPSPREGRGGGAMRLRWLREELRGHTVCNEGRTICRAASGADVIPWAAGTLLPTQSASSKWTLRIDASADDEGDMLVGVCDAPGRIAWGLYLHSGKLNRVVRFGAHETSAKQLSGVLAQLKPPPPPAPPAPPATDTPAGATATAAAAAPPAPSAPAVNDPRGVPGLNWMKMNWNQKPKEGEKPLRCAELSKALSSGKTSFTQAEVSHSAHTTRPELTMNSLPTFPHRSSNGKI